MCNFFFQHSLTSRLQTDNYFLVLSSALFQLMQQFFFKYISTDATLTAIVLEALCCQCNAVV